MKTNTPARILTAAGLGLLLGLFAPPQAPAQTPQPAPTPAPEQTPPPASPQTPPQAPAEPAMTGVQKELNALVQKIQTRLGALTAPPTETQFADELNQFDTLLAAHKDEKTDDVAQVLFMKAMLYSEVFNDPDKAIETLKQVKTDYPGTRPAALVDEGLPYLEMQKTAAAKKASLKAGVPFPDFAVKDTAGNALSVAACKGKVVLVDFWATWCPPCVAELPYMRTAYQKYHDKGFEVIGISLDRDAATLANYVTAQKIPWAQHRDDDGELAMRYGILVIPASFLLDREGRIVATDLRGPELEEHLAKLFGPQ
jgi:peroxiredoxin